MSWEERMGAKARAIREAEAERERLEREAQWEAEVQRAVTELKEREPEPPCPACYAPQRDMWSSGPVSAHWGHAWPNVKYPDPKICTHECHGDEPYEELWVLYA